MALTATGDGLTAAHRQLQTAVGIAAVAQAIRLWKLLDPSAIDATAPSWLAAMVDSIQGSRLASATLAASYLEAFRTAEVGDQFPPVFAAPAPVQQLQTSMLVTGPYSLKSAIGRGVPYLQAVDSALTNVTGAAMRHTMNAGRETVLATITAEGRGGGWRRVVAGDACDFCKMLASRGAVYGELGGDFASHDHCSCSVEPEYGGPGHNVQEVFTPSSRPSTPESRAAVKRWVAANSPAGTTLRADPIVVTAPGAKVTVAERFTMTPANRRRFGATVDRVNGLHDGIDNGLGPTSIEYGGKTRNLGGTFTPHQPVPLSAKNPAPVHTPIRSGSAEDYFAAYDAEHRVPTSAVIKVNDKGDGTEAFSLLHEMGHSFDYIEGKVPGNGSWASEGTGDAMSALMSAAHRTDTIRNTARYSDEFRRYYTSEKEIWARAYAQWAARRLGGPEAAALRQMQSFHIGYQWTSDENMMLRPFVEDALKERGLLPP